MANAVASSAADAVVATVPAVLGNVSVMSAVDEGPIKVTLFVPLSLSSKNSKNPAEVEPFFNCIPAFAIGVVSVGVVKVLFVNVFVVADKYVSNVSTVVCRIVPPSLVTMPSPPATAVVPADVPPSIRLSSAVVAVTPSRMFNSAVVDVTPSKMFSSAVVTVAPSSISSSASDIPALPIVTVPANVTLAPSNVMAVVVPDLIIKLPLLFVALPNVVPASLKNMSPPSASKTISVVASNVIVDPESISVITGVVSVLFVSVSVVALPTSVSADAGRTTVTLPE